MTLDTGQWTGCVYKVYFWMYKHWFLHNLKELLGYLNYHRLFIMRIIWTFSVLSFCLSSKQLWCSSSSFFLVEPTCCKDLHCSGRTPKHQTIIFHFPLKSSTDYLFSELIKLCVVDLHLPGSPGRPTAEILEAPVRGEDIIEKVETVTSHVHLIDLKGQKQDRDIIAESQPNTNQLPEYFLSFRNQWIFH